MEKPTKSVGKKWLDRVDNAIVDKKNLIVLAVVLFLTIVLMGDLLLRSYAARTTIIRLPATIYSPSVELKVGTEFANDKYFEIFALYGTSELGTFTPQTVGEKVNNVLGLFSKDARYKYEGQLTALALAMQKGLVEKRFVKKRSSVEMQKNESRAIVTVEGISEEKVANKPTNTGKPCEFKWVFSIEGGYVSGEDMWTNCFD